jgi:hypothetical protein
MFVVSFINTYPTISYEYVVQLTNTLFNGNYIDIEFINSQMYTVPDNPPSTTDIIGDNQRSSNPIFLAFMMRFGLINQDDISIDIRDYLNAIDDLSSFNQRVTLIRLILSLANDDWESFLDGTQYNNYIYNIINNSFIHRNISINRYDSYLTINPQDYVTVVTEKLDEACIICISDIDVGETLYTCQVCAKSFHKECISEWFSRCRNERCPHCRS